MEEKKTNKKSRVAIIAAMLLLLIGIVCLCGVTFAKYITSVNKPTQQATVAKWGFVVNANTDDLFGKQYSDTEIVADDNEDELTLDVVSTTNVVAPGTKGSMTFGVTGSAEVLAKLTFDFTVTSDVELKDSEGNVHNPVKWTLTEDSEDDALVDGGTLQAVEDALKEYSDVIEIGESVSLSFKLEWEWEFEVDDATNKLDTILGYAAQGKGTYGVYTVSDPAADGVITVREAVDENSDNDIVYTAVIDVDFGLTISVEQIQVKDIPADDTTGA